MILIFFCDMISYAKFEFADVAHDCGLSDIRV